MRIGRRALPLLGATALCVVALAPARLGDGSRPLWVGVVHKTGAALGKAAEVVEHALGTKPAAEQKPTDTAAIGPTLDPPQAQQDGSALKQAYLAAVADGRIRALGYDPAGIGDAIAAYKSENVAAGDALAGRITQPVVRAALEWVALRDATQKIGLGRLDAFGKAHPDWPTTTWLRHQAEARMFHVTDPKVVERYFAAGAPITLLGRYALAKALKADNRAGEGATIARGIYRDNDLSGALEAKFKSDFGADLTKADYKYRADRFLYKEQVGPALRVAAQAGPDVLALAKARAAAIAETQADKALAAVPEALRKDPGLILAAVQRLRREDKLMEAANLMQTAPRDPALLVDTDEWWTERRVLARRLLDNGNINAAYVICATHSAGSSEARVEAEFHAGWIALRFMNDPTRAAYHFAQAAKLADTPTSMARIAYWQARTAETSGQPDAVEKVDAFYRKAAAQNSTYYGQLARQMLGLSVDAVQRPNREATGTDRNEAIRAVELLYAAGERDVATPLAVLVAGSLEDGAQVAALASVVERQQDAHLSLTIGKILSQRGSPVDTLAFPTDGIPPYEELPNSAARPVVYAIARQESAFMPAVVSKAGAKGLMQIIDATAKRTAAKAGLGFDSARLTTDPAFNAQLGAAHLGELLAGQGGSLILTFAAYNAGAGRVKQWVEAYGDPRSPGVDPVDWVERIPFTETRNYVQRVIANVTMYRAIFAEQSRLAAEVSKRDRQAKL